MPNPKVGDYVLIREHPEQRAQIRRIVKGLVNFLNHNVSVWAKLRSIPKEDGSWIIEKYELSPYKLFVVNMNYGGERITMETMAISEAQAKSSALWKLAAKFGLATAAGVASIARRVTNITVYSE